MVSSLQGCPGEHTENGEFWLFKGIINITQQQEEHGVWKHSRTATFFPVSEPRHGDYCCLDNSINHVQQLMNTDFKTGAVLSIFLHMRFTLALCKHMIDDIAPRIQRRNKSQRGWLSQETQLAGCGVNVRMLAV